MRLKTMILSMKVLLFGAAVTTATATATAQGTTRTTGTERTVHAGDYVTTITVDGTPTTITNDVKSVTAAPGAKVKVTAAPPQQGKRARLVITKAASSTSGQGTTGGGEGYVPGGQTQTGTVTKVTVKGEGDKTTVNVNEMLQMVATVVGSEGISQAVTWGVCDNVDGIYPWNSTTTLASIDQDGKLTGKSADSIKVYAMSVFDDTKDGSCVIEVVDPNAQPQTGEDPGGQSTGQDTPGGQGEEQLSSKIGTEHGHQLKINFPDGKEIFHSNETITLSVSDLYVIEGVIWSVNIEPYFLDPSADSHSCKFTSGHLGTVRVTATLATDTDVYAYQDFQIVE